MRCNIVHALCLGGILGCAGPADESVIRAAAALTVGAEVTLLPDLPGGSAPIAALGHQATATVGGLRATAWRVPDASGSGLGTATVAFWTATGGIQRTDSLGAGVMSRPLVATDGAGFLVVWQSAAGLVAARYNGSGARLDATPLVLSATAALSADGDALACVYDGRDYALAFNDQGPTVTVVRVTTAGAVRDRRSVALVGANAAQHVRLAHAASGYLVAATGLYSSSFAYDQLQYARLGTDLALLDPTPRQIAATPRARSLKDVATDGADYLLLWSDDATPPTGAPRLLAARVAASSGALATVVDVGPASPAGEPGAAWAERASGGYLIARYNASLFTTRQLRDDGTFVETAPVTRTLSAGLDGWVSRLREGGGLTLTWAAAISGGLRALNAVGESLDGAVSSPARQPLTIPGGTEPSDVGLDWDGANFGVAWTESAGSWAARVSRSGTIVGDRAVALMSATYASTLAATPGQHLVVRQLPGATFSQSYVAQRRDATFGMVLGAETVVLNAERPPGFYARGGPLGYMVASGIGYVPGLSMSLGFLRTDGTLTRTVGLFNFRNDYPNVAFAANPTVWTVAWVRRDEVSAMFQATLVVNQYTPAGEFATVPLEVPLGTLPDRLRSEMAIASDGTDFLVVFGTASLMGLRVRANGTAMDTAPFRIGPLGSPRVEWDGHDYTVAWSSGTSIFATRVSTAGAVVDATPAELVTGSRINYALASDGAGTLALAYGRVASGGVVRATMRPFTWGASLADAGVDASTDVTAPADVAMPSDVIAPADVGPLDAGADAEPTDAGTDSAADVAAPDASAPDASAVDASTTDTRPADVHSTDVPTSTDVARDVATTDTATPPDDGGGCAVGGAPRRTHAPVAFGALLGLTIAARRRRRVSAPTA